MLKLHLCIQIQCPESYKSPLNHLIPTTLPKNQIKSLWQFSPGFMPAETSALSSIIYPLNWRIKTGEIIHNRVQWFFSDFSKGLSFFNQITHVYNSPDLLTYIQGLVWCMNCWNLMSGFSSRCLWSRHVLGYFS